MLKSTRRRSLTAAVSGIGIIWATAAAAQSAPATDTADAAGAAGADEIVVIGITKQAAALQDVPAAITAYTGSALEAQGIRQVREIALSTPGFSSRQAGSNPTAINLSMRGQVQNDPTATVEPSVGVYLDEFYVARTYGLNTDLLDVSSVQVLKGPQGTLFGRNTSAGALLLQTNDPKYGRISGLFSGTVGNLGQAVGTAVLNLGAEDVALRGAFSYSRLGDYQTDIYTGKEYGGRHAIDGRVKASFRPASNVEILLSGEWYDSKIHGPVRQNLYYNLGGRDIDPAAADRALFGGDPDKVAASQPSQVAGTPARGIYNDTKTQTYIAKIKIDTGIGQVKLISGYRAIQADIAHDLDGARAAGLFTQQSQDLEEWSNELQLTGSTMGEALSYAAGVTYLRETGNDGTRSSNNGSATWSNFRGDVDNDSYGIYAQLHYKVTDALGVTGGLRYSIDKKGITNQSALYPNNGTTILACLPNPAQLVDGVPIISPAAYAALLANDCRRGRSDTFHNLSYTAGIDYQLTEDVLLYAKQSTGYRAGGQQLRTLTLTDTTPAGPEKVSEQEIGLKSEFMDGRLRLNLAAYHNNVKGAQRSASLSVRGISQTILENADTETWGGEAEARFKVVKGLELFATGALTDPKYTSYNGFVITGAGVLTPSDKSDTNFVTIPRKQFSLGADYNGDLGFARLDLNVNYAWQAKMYQTEQTVTRLTTPVAEGGAGIATTASAQALLDAATIPAYGITNMRAALSFGPDDNYQFAVWGRNVFDKRVPLYALYAPGLNTVSVVWNEPVSYGVTMTVKF